MPGQLTGMSYQSVMNEKGAIGSDHQLRLDQFEIKEVVRSPRNHPKTAGKKGYAAGPFGRKSTIGA